MLNFFFLFDFGSTILGFDFYSRFLINNQLIRVVKHLKYTIKDKQ